MATVLGNLGNDFYSAFYEPDVAKRREALSAWVKSATSCIQVMVEEELTAFIEWVTEGRWTEDGWKRGEEKLRRIQNDYPLVMDIKLRKLGPSEKNIGQMPDSVEYRPPSSIGAPGGAAPAKAAMANSSHDDGGDDDYDDGGRSSNDDRSDSMNPNNDAYHAAMDNHSNQMNPNNDAYWSSRGR
ncbi:unnamed protein product, partial [marine sediment metagenome]